MQLEPSRERKLQRVLPFLAHGLLVAIFFAPVLFADETFLAVDNLRLYLPWASEDPDFRPQNTLITDPVNGVIYPTMRVFQEGIRAGSPPLWNPFVLLGVPQLPQSNPLEYAAYGALSIPTAHDALLALYLSVALVFAWGFLRSLGLHPLAAMLGSIAWGFDPYVMVWFEYEHCPLVAATLPAMLLCVEIWLRDHRPVALLGLATAAGFSLWADNVQLTVYAWLLVGGWTVLRAVWPPDVAVGDGARRDALRVLRSDLVPIVRSDLLPIGAALACAAVSAAGVVAGGLLVLEGSHREALDFEALYRHTGGMPWSYLRTLVFPDFYGTPLGGANLTPRMSPEHKILNYNELAIYTGIAPLLLACASLAWLRRPPLAFFAAGALYSLASAAGSIVYLPISLLPGLSVASPTRILFAWGFCVAMLAAFGLDGLLRSDGRRRGWALGAAGLVAVAALAIVLELQSNAGIVRAFGDTLTPEQTLEAIAAMREYVAVGGPALTARQLAGLVLGLALVAGLAAARASRTRLALGLALTGLAALDLVSFAAGYATTAPRALVYPATPGIRFLQEAGRTPDAPFRVAGFEGFLHGTLAPFGLHDIGGFVSFLPRRSGEMLLAADVPGLISSETTGWDAAPPGGVAIPARYVLTGSPVLDLLNVRYVLVPPGRRPGGRGSLDLVYDGEIRIFRNPHAFPRAFFVERYELVQGEVAAYRALREASREDLRGRVLLETPPPEAFRDLEGDGVGAPSEADVRITAYAANEVQIEVDAPTRGFVVLADAWYPSWVAAVDGEPTAILRADYGLRAVPVRAGLSRIVMQMQPRSLQAGFAITAASWLVLGAAWVVCGGARAVRRRSESGSPGSRGP